MTKTALNGAALCGVFWYRSAGDVSVIVCLCVCPSVAQQSELDTAREHSDTSAGVTTSHSNQILKV